MMGANLKSAEDVLQEWHVISILGYLLGAIHDRSERNPKRGCEFSEAYTDGRDGMAEP